VYSRYREPAWEALNLWDEHTWGADAAVRCPEGEDSHSQWHHKAIHAYTARSISLLLQRDGVAELARYLPRDSRDDFLLFNPLPWARTLSGPIQPALTRIRGTDDDGTAGRHHLDRRPLTVWHMEDLASPPFGSEARWLPPTVVPGFGYTVVPGENVRTDPGLTGSSEAGVVENSRFRITFDREEGGVTSLYDRLLDWEWVDTDSPYPFHGYVHEQVADRDADWPRSLLFAQEWRAPRAETPPGWKTTWRSRREQPAGLTDHRVFETALGYAVVQRLQAPGCVGPLTQRVLLPHEGGYVECESWWQMGLTDHPEATYLLFPFNVPGAVPRFDLGCQPVVPEIDQLPGVCRDYFTVQGWVDFSNDDLGVTVATPENPMVQIGDFHFGHYQTRFDLERALLLGWVTNNYWETNFRAHQPGRVHARYRIQPHAGPFNEAAAHRFGVEAMADELVLQPLTEPRVGSAKLPVKGQLLRLPEPPVMTLHVKPATDGAGLIVRMLNASDEPQVARIGAEILQIVAAKRCDLFEVPVDALAIADGVVSVDMPARQVTVIRLATDVAQ
jgi:hypothetical protein